MLAESLVLPSGLKLENRIAKAAMSETLGELDGAPTERLSTLTRRFAQGGLALQITGNVMVDPAHVGEPGNVVADRRHLAGFRRWAQSSPVPTLVQLNHPGRQSPKMVNRAPVAPSAVRLNKVGAFATPRALTTAEVDDVVDRFVAAAVLVDDAGFAGIEVHGAHGYLVSQFLSPVTNLRTDQWGGSLENRARFLMEIVRRTRKATRPGFTIAVKLNSADFQRGGFSEGDALEVARMLDEEGIDLLEVSGGTYETAAMFAGPKRASTAAREAFFLDYAESIRRVLKKTPLMLTGGFRTSAGMEAALAGGAVDVIGLARPLAPEPDLPRELLAGTKTAAAPGPAPLGIRAFDELIGISWYQDQMFLLADGKEPRPQLSRLGSLLRKLIELARQPTKKPLSLSSSSATSPTPGTA